MQPCKSTSHLSKCSWQAQDKCPRHQSPHTPTIAGWSRELVCCPQLCWILDLSPRNFNQKSELQLLLRIFSVPSCFNSQGMKTGVLTYSLFLAHSAWTKVLHWLRLATWRRKRNASLLQGWWTSKYGLTFFPTFLNSVTYIMFWNVLKDYYSIRKNICHSNI
jgi:hypothetical protein